MRIRAVVIPLLFVAPVAFGCLETELKGVHFKGFPVDFGQPPHRNAIMWASEDWGSENRVAWRPGTEFLWESSWSGGEAEGDDAVTNRYRRGLTAEREGRVADARALYKAMLAGNMGDAAYLRKRLFLLSLGNAKATLGLAEMRDATAFPGKAGPAPLPAKVAPPLQTLLTYERILRQSPKASPERAQRFYDAGRRNPEAPWGDACLISCARDLLSETSAKPTAQQRTLARAALGLILEFTPHSRFTANAYAWQGRLYYLDGVYGRAVPMYRKAASLAPDSRQFRLACESAAQCYIRLGRRAEAATWYIRCVDDAGIYQALRNQLENFKPVDAKRFWAELRKDPALLNAYLDYRLDYTKVTPALLHSGRVALATRKTPLLSRTRARLAEAALRLNSPDSARAFANAALASHPTGDDHALPTFILATIDMRARRFAAARLKYESILRQEPNSYLAGGARENLALIGERTGNFGEALQRYSELGYSEDFAYIADARMTPEQIAAYLRRRGAVNREVLTYTLGMRYLRLGNWNAADRTFRRLSAADRKRLMQGTQEYAADAFKDEGGIQDPVKTAADLRHLSNSVGRARGSERKAQAMLDLANYYYTHHYLLLYSPALWNGGRITAISFSWNPEIATHQDNAALRRHFAEHECFAHTVEICREILRKYPRTKAADHAAYRAGCAAERLEHMSPYLRWQDKHEDTLGQAVAFFRRAGRSSDPVLHYKGNKYAKVFAAARHEKRMAFASEKSPSRTWRPGEGW